MQIGNTHADLRGNMKIILLNGPPRAGKDEYCKGILNAFPDARHLKFAQPLRDAVCTFFKVEDYEIEDLKARDKRVRSFMISLSEKTTKPLLGKDYFGVRAAKAVRALEHSVELFVVSDAGFQYEVDAFLNELPVEAQIWQIHRPATSFLGDSREWVTPQANSGAELVHVINDHPTLTDLYKDAYSRATDFVYR